MAVTYLRHTTPLVAADTCYGMTDLSLTAGFEAEAERSLSVLERPCLVVSSPLHRCLRLAERAATRFGVEMTVSQDWREMDFGDWEGRPWSALPRDELDAWAADFMGYKGHGGESVTDLATRIAAAREKIPDHALVVTHMGCIKAVLAGQGAPDPWQARLPFGGYLTL